MKRLLALLTIFALTAAPLAPSIEAAPAGAAGLAVPITGASVPIPGSTDTGTFNGTFRITRFVNSAGKVFAQGVLTGVATTTIGGVTSATSIVRTVSTPVDLTQPQAAAAPAVAAAPGAISAQAVCDILHLVLGPLDLNLLGLRIQLNRVVLDITGETGPGNLLGNLLCALFGILDGGNTNAIVNLLNQILGALGGLGL